MNDIDNQDELKKESEDLSKQLQEIHSAIEQQKFLLRDMQFMTESLEQISKKLDYGAEITKRYWVIFKLLFVIRITFNLPPHLTMFLLPLLIMPITHF